MTLPSPGPVNPEKALRNEHELYLNRERRIPIQNMPRNVIEARELPVEVEGPGYRMLVCPEKHRIGGGAHVATLRLADLVPSSLMHYRVRSSRLLASPRRLIGLAVAGEGRGCFLRE